MAGKGGREVREEKSIQQFTPSTKQKQLFTALMRGRRKAIYRSRGTRKQQQKVD